MTTEQRTGPIRQLPPEEEQVVGTEQQMPRVVGDPLPVIEDIDRREPPGPGAGLAQISLPAGLTTEQALQRRFLIGLPALFMNRYEGTDTDWQMLARWDIPDLVQGDLHEISLATNNAAKTRYRIIIAGRDMNIPDRQVAALLAFPWRDNVIPGPAQVTLEVRSTDATSIIVDGFMSGTER